MASFGEVFTVLPAFRAAVCREHHGTVTAKSAVSHIGSYHGHLGAHARQSIAAEAAALRADGSLAADVHGIRFPDDIIPAIDGLPVWGDGKKCISCGYIRRTRQDIQKHCRSEHGWVNPRGRGGKPGSGPAGGLGEAWVDGVHCQRFGQTGPLQRLFEVVPPAGQGGQGGQGQGESGSAQKAIEAAFEASAKAIKKKDEEAVALVNEQSRLSANIWVRRTGWPRHLRGFDRGWLATTTRGPVPAGEEDTGRPPGRRPGRGRRRGRRRIRPGGRERGGGPQRSRVGRRVVGRGAGGLAGAEGVAGRGGRVGGG